MIVCCGEALIDMIPTLDASGAQCFAPHPGGAVFNTSIALGRLRTRTGFVSGISSDLFGDMLRRALQGSNVEIDTIIQSDKPTTLAFVQLTNGHATYHFFDENSAGRMLTPAVMPTLPNETTALYFGGISLINTPAADFYVDLAVRESRERVIVADPNIRANFVHDVATYRARLDRLIKHTDLLKVSDEDLNWIEPGPLTLIEKASKLRDMGPEIVIITRGGDGATALFGDDETIEVPAQRAQVVDTVGAGDTFNAGVMAKLSSKGLLFKTALQSITADNLTDALAFGAKVAAITVSRAGANSPWSHELDS